MSTIIYQNHASPSFDSDTNCTTLKLKVGPPPLPPTNFHDLFFNQTVPKQFERDTSFFNTLPSPNSLELCTETLGSETGCEISSSTHFNYDLEVSKQRKKPLKKMETNKKMSSNNYPPPLSTLGHLQMRRYREEGRLVIEAVEKPIRSLHAERSDGRLRIMCISTSIIDEEQEQEQDEEEDLEEEKEEIDMERFERVMKMSRCVINENEGLCSSNWKPALNWVATS